MNSVEKYIGVYENLEFFLDEAIKKEIRRNKVVLNENGKLFIFSVDDCVSFFNSLVSMANLTGGTSIYYTPECNPVDENEGVPLSEFCPKLKLLVDRSIPSII